MVQMRSHSSALSLHRCNRLAQVQVPAERVTSMAFSPNGSTLAVSCWGGAVFLYQQQECALDASLQTGSAAAIMHGLSGAAPAGEAPDGAPEGQRGGDVLADAVPAAEDAALGEQSGRGMEGDVVAAPEEAAGQGNAMAYESRLAVIEHGAGGRGGWRPARACLPGQPVKPDVSGPTLMEWLGDDGVLITTPSGQLTFVKMENAGMVRSCI